MNLWNPLDIKNILDPYPMYRAIREEEKLYKAQTGEYIATRYEDVLDILQNKNDFGVGNKKIWLEKGINYLKNKDLDLTAISEAINSFILLLNPPEHQRIRKFVFEAWNDREVTRIIEDNCVSLLKNVETEPFDFMTSFAFPLPGMTMAKIMGIAHTDYIHLQQLGEQMVKALDIYLKIEDLVKIDSAAKEFIEFFRNVISKPPESGLLKKLIDNNTKLEQPLSDRELISISIFLFVAGEETTTSLLGTGLYNLLKHNLYNDLKEHEIDATIEELLRFDGPVHLLGRIVNHDVRFKDQDLKKGSLITLCLAAANRDPSQFQNPESLDLKRNPRHIAFGSGIHYCMGDWLAKTQVSIAFKNFKQAYPYLKLVTTDVSWKNQLATRRLSKLMVHG